MRRLWAWYLKVEGDPATQYKAHKIGARVWLVLMIIIPVVLVFLPMVWKLIALLFITEISLYANWSNDAGVMASANAATDEDITDVESD